MLRTLFALFLLAAPAHAQSEFPNILGTWEIASGSVMTHDGKVLSLTEMPAGDIVITTQQGPVFRGAYRWHHPEGTELSDGETTTHRAEETFVGTFSGDRTTFTMADTPDRGYWFGRLTEDGTIELQYIESGPNAAAGYSVMRRVE
ncbi:MAG: hypothetical protein AAGF45_03975 [Pseudomonadota bacterium]